MLDALGLTRTGPELDPSRADEYATGHTSLAYADVQLPVEPVDTRAMAAATGFYGTAEDVVRYAAAHLPGDDRLLPDAAKRRMQRTVAPVGKRARRRLRPGPRRDRGRRAAAGRARRRLPRPHHAHPARPRGAARRVGVHQRRRRTRRGARPRRRAARRPRGAGGGRAARPHGPGRADRGHGARVRRVVRGAVGARGGRRAGGRLVALDPTAADPAAEVAWLSVVDDSTLRVERQNGYGAPGEVYRFRRDAAGRVTSVRGPSGVSMWPVEVFAASIAGRDRIELASGGAGA